MPALSEGRRPAAPTPERPDRLTGLQERESFRARLSAETRHATADGRPLSLMIVGIDDFEALRRQAGSATADACAQIIVETMTRTVRRVGMFCARLECDQFGIILPATDTEAVWALGRNVVHAVRQLGLRHPLGGPRLIAVSAGVATNHGRFDLDGQALWVVTDQALNHAFAAGGDRVSDSGAQAGTPQAQ